MIKKESKIQYSYLTVKMTKSRIDKGLLAFPRAMVDWFPKQKGFVKLFLDNSKVPQLKTYTPYTSSTRECRIGGLSYWFKKNHIKDGDEIVIQIIDRENYIFRLIYENNFVIRTRQLQEQFDNSPNEEKAFKNLLDIAEWTRVDKEIVILNEFNRLIQIPIEDRRTKEKHHLKFKEITPPSLKTLLGEIYKGHCQVCDFWFLKKDGTPYYEIHHIDNLLGAHPKNLLLVCGNCHNQFTYAQVRYNFRDGWLSKVYFNEREFRIEQLVFNTKFPVHYKNVYLLE